VTDVIVKVRWLAETRGELSQVGGVKQEQQRAEHEPMRAPYKRERTFERIP